MKNKTFLDFETAVQKSLDIVQARTITEFVPLLDSLGKVLAKDVVCVKNLPSFNNSAMDGFAVKFSDKNRTLMIKKTIFAGDKGDDVKPILKQGECYKIMTGAKVPDDVDTIVPIENCMDVQDDKVTIPNDIKQGANLRLKGEEQAFGNTLLKKGERITSSHITLLASQGIMMLEVFKNISAAVLSTGNEIKEPWQTSDDEEIFNCNSFALISQLKEKGFDATYCGVVPDDLEASKLFIKNLKSSYDVIITSGGISMGDADFVGEAFLQNGLQTAFHGVNIKPGRPIMMGQMDNTTVVCLPGNPLTAMVNVYLFVIPMLLKLQGNSRFYQSFEKALNTSEFKTKSGRVNIVLGTVLNGKFKVTRNNKYGSGMISAIYESNCILVTNESTSEFIQNQEVKVIPFKTRFCKPPARDIFN